MPTSVTYLYQAIYTGTSSQDLGLYVGFLLFETEFPIAQAGPELAMQPRMIFNPDPPKC